MTAVQLRATLARAETLRRRGNLEAAADHLSRHRATHGRSPALNVMLGEIQLAMGHYSSALSAFVETLEVAPRHVGALQGVAWCLARRPTLAFSLPSPAVIADALACAHVDPDLVAQGGWAILARSESPLDHPLLLPLLRHALVTDPTVEQFVVRARRELCLSPPPEPTRLAAALAAQGRLNEYVWSVSDLEHALLAQSPPWVRAMYAPTDYGSNPARRDSTDVHGTSPAVQQQYEENPYPRWHRINRPSLRSLTEHLSLLSDGTYQPPMDPSPTHMLVAGCGTGREMIGAALTWSPMSVVGVDLSRTSLDYAQAMAAAYGVAAQLHHMDLLDLSDWRGEFDLVVCTGVLHHLDHPTVGWRVLRDRLRPGGVMLVGLYSRLARESIVEAQRESRRYPPTREGIRAARDHLRRLPHGHPAHAGTGLRDFYYTSGCRDLLMHPREHLFTIPDIARTLEQLDLRFLGFDVDPAVRRRHRILFGRTGVLSDWEQFERLYPETFLGMYQFWVQRPERSTLDE